jgi:hypothetical protein
MVSISDPSPPPPSYTLNTNLQYTYSHRGRWGGELSHSEGYRGNISLGRKYQHDWMYLQSINLDKHLPQSLFAYMSIFLDNDILLWCLYS